MIALSCMHVVNQSNCLCFSGRACVRATAHPCLLCALASRLLDRNQVRTAVCRCRADWYHRVRSLFVLFVVAGGGFTIIIVVFWQLPRLVATRWFCLSI